jgi:hypothetical protein
MARDVRLGIRRLRKEPGFAFVVILILALGIGANTAIYSLVDRVLLRPLPYPDPSRLAMIARHFETDGGNSDQFGQNGVTWLALHQNASLIDVAAASGTTGLNLASDERRPEYVEAERVSAGFFHVLGVAPALGREFSVAEDRQDGPAAAILSHTLWGPQSRDFQPRRFPERFATTGLFV